MPDLAGHSDAQVVKWLRRERKAAYSGKRSCVNYHRCANLHQGFVFIAGAKVSLGYWRDASEMAALVNQVRAEWWQHLEAEAQRRGLLDENRHIRMDIRVVDVRRSAPSGDDLTNAPWSIGRAWIYWHGIQRVSAALGIKPITLSHALVGEIPKHMLPRLLELSGGRFTMSDFAFVPSFRNHNPKREHKERGHA